MVPIADTHHCVQSCLLTKFHPVSLLFTFFVIKFIYSENFHQLFDWQYIGQIIGGDFAKFSGLLRIHVTLRNIRYEFLVWSQLVRNQIKSYMLKISDS